MGFIQEILNAPITERKKRRLVKKALHNFHNNKRADKTLTATLGITRSFMWGDSKEGSAFWQKVYTIICA